MKKYSLGILYFLVLFFSFSFEIKAEEVGELHALSAVLMDGESGRILYEKNGSEFRANASTTKILTCILALELGRSMEEVKVSAYAATMPDVQLNIREGERYYLKDLLYSLMLESHNDTAVAIAEHLAGSCENFARIMNKKAKEIGCDNTYFLTPNGLDATLGEKSHGTTASDLARILQYCIFSSPKSSEFLEITGTSSYRFTDLEQKRSFLCRNHNTFLTMMEGAYTGKTGFTNKAGYCYVGALRQDMRNFIVVVLGSGWPGNKNYKWQDCKEMIEYGLEHYQRYELDKILPVKEEIKRIRIENAQNEVGEYSAEVLLEIEDAEDGILLKAEEQPRIKIEKYELSAPLKKGKQVGTVSWWLENEKLAERKLYLKNEVKEINYRWCLSILLKRIFS